MSMKKLSFLLLCSLWLMPAFGQESTEKAEVPSATAAAEIVSATPPVPRDAVLFSYRGMEMTAGVFMEMSMNSLERIYDEDPKDKDQQILDLLEYNVFSVCVAEEGKKLGCDKDPEIVRVLHRKEIDWLADYYVGRKVHENYDGSEDILKKYYEDNIDKYREAERFQFRHIFFKTVDESPEKKKEALKRAEDVMARLKAGEDFGRVAEEVSESPKKGAVVGPFLVNEPDPSKRIDQKIQETVLALETGKYSDIIETKYGLEILRLEEHILPDPKPFQIVRAEIDRELRLAYVTQLKKDTVAQYFDKAVKDWNPEIVNDSAVKDEDLVCTVYGEPLNVGYYRSMVKGREEAIQKEIDKVGLDSFIRYHLVFRLLAYKKAIEMGLDKRLPSIERKQLNELRWIQKAYLDRTWKEYEDAHPITEEMIQKAYEDNKIRILAPRDAEIAEIFRAIPDHNPDVRYEVFKAQQAAQAPLEKAIERIKAGEDFSAVAKEVSEATNAV
ncbi:MAG TPA: peptidylprolyl isomerase, partial [bacterium]|nr:peptidylprolyl isomerase [bacterium]